MQKEPQVEGAIPSRGFNTPFVSPHKGEGTGVFSCPKPYNCRTKFKLVHKRITKLK